MAGFFIKVTMQFRESELSASVALFIGLLLVLLVYWPGLSGDFIFDDFPNLSMLGSHGSVHDWYTLSQYIKSGFAGPTGRPISLLSFLLDSNTWPASPEPFKYTNLMIHALNVCLVVWVMVWVFRFIENKISISPRSLLVSVAAGICWGLHPYLVSTNLYVVQRMAQLSALFCLAGLVIYLKGRWLVGVKPRAGYLCLIFSFPICGILAVFSKENGALLPVLALTLEATVVASNSATTRISRYWKWLFLIVPTLLIIGYLVRIGFHIGWTHDYQTRVFSPWERLLTETRITWMYLYQWFVPHIFSGGVFHDDIKISAGLFTPLTTLISLLSLVVLGCISWVLRRQSPLFSLAVLFFLASQLIESTTVGLELMFEHRIYLGSIFLYVPILSFIIKKVNAKLSALFLCILIALLATFCYQSSSLWGNYPEMIMVWAKAQPYSPRSQTEAARMLYNNGNKAGAMRILDASSKKIPNDFSLRLTQVMIQCRIEAANEKDLGAVLRVAGSSKYSVNDFNLLQRLLSWRNGGCRGIPKEFILDITSSFLSLKENSNRKSLIYAQLKYIEGVAFLQMGEDEKAKAAFVSSVASRERPEKLMNIAAYLATYNQFDGAITYAQRAENILISGTLRGKPLAEAPELSDVEDFIEAVKKGQNQYEKYQRGNTGKK